VTGPSDHELIVEIQSGRRDALGVLFDRYSPALFEFIYHIIGNRDQAARLLEKIFTRLPSVIAGGGDHRLVRGWLYSLAREASLTFLRQKNWLDALPPSDEPSVSGLAGDIWRAARAMPAFHRAVLVVEELHGLLPTEKARALNVAHTDLPCLVDDARRSFNDQFDLLAPQQRRSLSTQIVPKHSGEMHRRTGTDGSIFGRLPAVSLPNSLAATVRTNVLTSLQSSPPAGESTPEIIIKQTNTEQPAPPEPLPPSQPSLPWVGCSVPVIVTALLIAFLITSLATYVGYLFTRDTTPPTITRVAPADETTLPPNPAGGTRSATTRVLLAATYRDDRAVDVKSIRLVLDGRDVTAQALVSDTSLSYPVDLDPGRHVVLLELHDPSDNKTWRVWQFTIAMPPEATPTPTPTSTATPTATVTRIPTPTATGTLTPPPKINDFRASQTTVTRGTSVLLSWSVSNADIVFLNQDKVDPSGTKLVSPTTTTTFYLIANNVGGTTDRAITLVVQALPDLTVSDISVNAAGQVVYTIRNIGTGDVTQTFLIQVYADGLPIYFNNRGTPVSANQDFSLAIPNYTLVGTHVITVRVNPQQEVQESNYNNNELTRTLIGPTPTPTFTSTPTSTSTATPTNTPTITPPPTNTATNTPTPTPINTP
jgi:DNA-directed RNA polymerase specialized sigma24 family protein